MSGEVECALTLVEARAIVKLINGGPNDGHIWDQIELSALLKARAKLTMKCAQVMQDKLKREQATKRARRAAQ